MPIFAMLWTASAHAQEAGVRLVGRWLSADGVQTASYAGSMIVLRFKGSADLAADFNVIHSKGSQDLFISVSVDGGRPTRIPLARGPHRQVRLASGLSPGPHVVTVRKEGEPYFGALQFASPKLDVSGRWQPAMADDHPIIEVIGDSDATGICALGPDSPASAVSIYNSAWASEAASWVGLLEAQLAAVGHPADLVDLAISGSTTESEAAAYEDIAPDFSKAKFIGYSGARRHASAVLLWGGANDRHAGGDLAGSLPVTYRTLSRFQKGVYDQLTKIYANSPDAMVVLLGYSDATIPDWQPAYRQVQALFPDAQQQRMHYLRVYDPKGKSDACEIDPRGHPNAALHAAWAGQILAWLLTGTILREAGFPEGEHWDDP